MLPGRTIWPHSSHCQTLTKAILGKAYIIDRGPESELILQPIASQSKCAHCELCDSVFAIWSCSVVDILFVALFLVVGHGTRVITNESLDGEKSIIKAQDMAQGHRSVTRVK